jgi:hypothetical protein
MTFVQPVLQLFLPGSFFSFFEKLQIKSSGQHYAPAVLPSAKPSCNNATEIFGDSGAALDILIKDKMMEHAEIQTLDGTSTSPFITPTTL